MRKLLSLCFLLAVTAVAMPAVAQQSAKPVITVTTTPPKDAGGPDKMAVIAGSVQGAPKDSRIVIFAHGDIWYVQPYAASPYTKLADGKFQTDTHLGTQYAVLVVRPAYKPPASTGDLPDEGGDIMAIKIVAGR
jgi:hypothetical protein